ncbi:MAG: retropepsin-like aspartic protease [Candidatus Ratteibacteria bacterium]|nr:retropepsin-like aspartic protease [Candidatus Ratteibacteria bacterium]
MPPLSNKMAKQLLQKIILKEGIISLYAKLKGSITSRTVKMALDTGATYTMIPAEIARDIGCNPEASKKQIEISTASGLILCPLVTVSAIKSCGLNLKNIEVICHSLPHESPVEGLLGLNFLLHFPAFIEFYQRIQLPANTD